MLRFRAILVKWTLAITITSCFGRSGSPPDRDEEATGPFWMRRDFGPITLLAGVDDTELVLLVILNCGQGLARALSLPLNRVRVISTTGWCGRVSKPRRARGTSDLCVMSVASEAIHRATLDWALGTGDPAPARLSERAACQTLPGRAPA